VSEVALSAAEGSRAPLLAPRGLAALPARHPRVLALDLADEGAALDAVQRTIGQALATAGLYEADRRPFRPHVTVARLRRGAVWRGRALAAPPIEPFVAERVVLFRSHLSQQGARYAPLAAVRLAR
jgi:2'-5' RNA ligase